MFLLAVSNLIFKNTDVNDMDYFKFLIPKWNQPNKEPRDLGGQGRVQLQVKPQEDWNR